MFVAKGDSRRHKVVCEQERGREREAAQAKLEGAMAGAEAEVHFPPP